MCRRCSNTPRTVYYIDNLEIACLTPDSITFYNIDREQIEKQPSTIEWDAEAAEKGGYEHFMMKEIREQPAAVRDNHQPAHQGRPCRSQRTFA